MKMTTGKGSALADELIESMTEAAEILEGRREPSRFYPAPAKVDDPPSAAPDATGLAEDLRY